jgi:hypothetical protein
MNRPVFYALCLLTVLLIFPSFNKIRALLITWLQSVLALNRIEKISIILLVLFVLSAVSTKITLGDSMTYHAQNIQWIQKYSVVPGLGNFHNRFAFNNMFFVISAIFSFQIKGDPIYPLNGLCYVILAVSLFNQYKKENPLTEIWTGIILILVFLVSLLILLPDLNAPAPDIICIILVIYTFIQIFKTSYRKQYDSMPIYILMNLVVFSCCVFKISSVFLLPALLFFVEKELRKKIVISLIIGILVFAPFFIRNYYLSGYLVYPFPGIDLFNPDWKIPIERVAAMKTEIESFAKINGGGPDEVAAMTFTEWVIPWFASLNIISKVLILVNLSSIIRLLIMIIKHNFRMFMIQVLVLINLGFWIATAPDPRFVYGFLFVGFSVSLAYLIKLFNLHRLKLLSKYIFVLCLLAIVFKRIMFPIEIMKDPHLLIKPAEFGNVITETRMSGFEYHIPVPEGECYNAAIPCVSFPVYDVVLRGKDLQDGFRLEIIH